MQPESPEDIAAFTIKGATTGEFCFSEKDISRIVGGRLQDTLGSRASLGRSCTQKEKEIEELLQLFSVQERPFFSEEGTRMAAPGTADAISSGRSGGSARAHEDSSAVHTVLSRAEAEERVGSLGLRQFFSERSTEKYLDES